MRVQGVRNVAGGYLAQAQEEPACAERDEAVSAGRYQQPAQEPCAVEERPAGEAEA